MQPSKAQAWTCGITTTTTTLNARTFFLLCATPSIRLGIYEKKQSNGNGARWNSYKQKGRRTGAPLSPLGRLGSDVGFCDSDELAVVEPLLLYRMPVQQAAIVACSFGAAKRNMLG